jgi:hypothetical protein
MSARSITGHDPILNGLSQARYLSTFKSRIRELSAMLKGSSYREIWFSADGVNKVAEIFLNIMKKPYRWSPLSPEDLSACNILKDRILYSEGTDGERRAAREQIEAFKNQCNHPNFASVKEIEFFESANEWRTVTSIDMRDLHRDLKVGKYSFWRCAYSPPQNELDFVDFSPCTEIEFNSHNGQTIYLTPSENLQELTLNSNPVLQSLDTSKLATEGFPSLKKVILRNNPELSDEALDFLIKVQQERKPGSEPLNVIIVQCPKITRAFRDKLESLGIRLERDDKTEKSTASSFPGSSPANPADRGSTLLWIVGAFVLIATVCGLKYLPRLWRKV